jgi:hypothetical protein
MVLQAVGQLTVRLSQQQQQQQQQWLSQALWRRRALQAVPQQHMLAQQ